MVMVTDPQRYARRMIRARTMSSATLNGVAPVAAAQRSTPRVMAPMRATEASTAAPEYWWPYALMLSTMIPSLVNLIIGGTSLVRGLPEVPSLLLRYIP